MNPEATLLAALRAYKSAYEAARDAAILARDSLKDEPLATSLKAYSALENIAYVAPAGMPSIGPDSQVADAIAQLEARAAAVSA